MTGRFSCIGCVLLLLALIAGCAANRQGGIRPAADMFESSWVAIVMGGMTGEPGGGVMDIALELKNKTATPIWVRAHFDTPVPSPDCEMVAPIAPGETASYRCRQERVVPGIDYSVRITTFTDEGLTSEVEERETQINFGKRDAEVLQLLIAPVTLPAGFEHVIHVEKFGWKRAMFGDLASKSGRLTVRVDGISYSLEGSTTNVPMSAVKTITRNQAYPSGWVVVEYEVGGQAKILGLNASVLKGSTNMGEVFRALLSAKNRYMKGKKP